MIGRLLTVVLVVTSFCRPAVGADALESMSPQEARRIVEAFVANDPAGIALPPGNGLVFANANYVSPLGYIVRFRQTHHEIELDRFHLRLILKGDGTVTVDVAPYRVRKDLSLSPRVTHRDAMAIAEERAAGRAREMVSTARLMIAPGGTIPDGPPEDRLVWCVEQKQRDDSNHRSDRALTIDAETGRVLQDAAVSEESTR
jgi:hypothetical protein